MTWESQSLSAEEGRCVLLYLEKKQEQQKIWTQAWSDDSLCEEVLTRWADLKGPALTVATDQKLYFLPFLSCWKRQRLRGLPNLTDEITYFLGWAATLSVWSGSTWVNVARQWTMQGHRHSTTTALLGQGFSNCVSHASGTDTMRWKAQVHAGVRKSTGSYFLLILAWLLMWPAYQHRLSSHKFTWKLGVSQFTCFDWYIVSIMKYWHHVNITHMIMCKKSSLLHLFIQLLLQTLYAPPHTRTWV